MNLEINRITGFLCLLVTLLVFHSLKSGLNPSEPHRSIGSTGEDDLFIQAAEGVRCPGVYRFGHQPNLVEVIERAGGLTSNIVLPEAFQHVTLCSGTAVTVRREGNDTKYHLCEMSAFYRTTLGIPISLNRESETGLMAIPGIGQGLAKAIVQERSKRGGFKGLDEVLSVDGIGPKLYGKMRPYLTL